MARSSNKTTSRTRSSTPPTSAGVSRSLAASPSAAAAPKSAKAPESSTPAPSETGAEPVIEVEEDASLTGPELKKQELVQKVVERSGIKKRDAKPVVEAMLSVLGEALAEGRQLDLQPLGKLMINRSNEKTNARVLFTKIRQNKNALAAEKDTVADVTL